MTNTPNTEPEGPRLTAATIRMALRFVAHGEDCRSKEDGPETCDCGSDDTLAAAKEALSDLEAKLAAAERERDEARTALDALRRAAITLANNSHTFSTTGDNALREIRALAAGKQATGEGVAKAAHRLLAVLSPSGATLKHITHTDEIREEVAALREALAAAPSERAGETSRGDDEAMLRAKKLPVTMTADFTTNVCAIRRKSDGYWWECSHEHGGGWNDKRIRQAWTHREARIEVAKHLADEDVEIVELGPRAAPKAGALVEEVINALTAPNRSEHQRVRDAILALAQAVEALR